MGYQFNQHESIARNINRILAEQINAAIGALENPDESKEESIHGVRKGIKKIRALFRLVRSELKEKDFDRENTHYRQIGHQLSQLRDATVMIKTLDKLQQAYPSLLSPQVFSTLKKSLTQKQDQISGEFFKDDTKLEEVVTAFRQAPRRVRGLSKKHRSFSVFAPNMKGIYRRARKALRVATREPSMDNLHELRKEVKTIWYHTRLLEPIWPGLLAAFGKEIGRLGELLGEDHDYGVLADEIESDRLLLRNQQTKQTILQLLHQQRTRLQEEIFPLANRVLAQKANAFVGQYRLYWKLWQAEVRK